MRSSLSGLCVTCPRAARWSTLSLLHTGLRAGVSCRCCTQGCPLVEGAYALQVDARALPSPCAAVLCSSRSHVRAGADGRFGCMLAMPATLGAASLSPLAGVLGFGVLFKLQSARTREQAEEAHKAQVSHQHVHLASQAPARMHAGGGVLEPPQPAPWVADSVAPLRHVCNQMLDAAKQAHERTIAYACHHLRCVSLHSALLNLLAVCCCHPRHPCPLVPV